MESLAFKHGTVRVRTSYLYWYVHFYQGHKERIMYLLPYLFLNRDSTFKRALSPCGFKLFAYLSFCKNICCPYKSCEKFGCFLRYVGNKKTLLSLGEVVAKMDEDSDGVIRVEHVNKVTTYFGFI
jgi:hypothetical protein